MKASVQTTNSLIGISLGTKGNYRRWCEYLVWSENVGIRSNLFCSGGFYGQFIRIIKRVVRSGVPGRLGGNAFNPGERLSSMNILIRSGRNVERFESSPSHQND